MPLFELLLTALDTLRANKVRAVLTTLGVIIGVGVMIGSCYCIRTWQIES